ncbi:MAG: hypothetical protein WBW04_05795 [Nitrolancea sp.]
MLKDGVGPFLVSIALYPAFLTDNLQDLMFIFAILTIAVPYIRKSYLEWRFRLKPVPDFPLLDEVQEFVRLYAPNIQLRANLIRPSPLAFVYPLGYRSTAIALFGGFFKLWRADREAAESILLHEIGHYRKGDVHIIGAGSMFDFVVKFAVIYYGICMPVVLLLCLLLGVTVGPVTDSLFAANILTYQLVTNAGFTFSHFASYLSVIFVYLTYVIVVFAVPLAAIWSAELNADLYAAATVGSSDGWMRGIRSLTHHPTRLQTGLHLLSHPSIRIRTWLLARWDRATWLLLLVYPAGYLIQLAALHVRATISYWMSDFSASTILNSYLPNSKIWLVDHRAPFLTIAALVIVWPWIGPSWEMLMAGSTERRRIAIRSVPVTAVLVVVALTSLIAPTAKSWVTPQSMHPTTSHDESGPLSLEDMLPTVDNFEHRFTFTKQETVSPDSVPTTDGFVNGASREFVVEDLVDFEKSLVLLTVECDEYESSEQAQRAFEVSHQIGLSFANVNIEDDNVELVGDVDAAAAQQSTSSGVTLSIAMFWVRENEFMCSYQGYTNGDYVPLPEVIAVAKQVLD